MKSFLILGLLTVMTVNGFGKGGTNQVVFAAANQGDATQLKALFEAHTNLLSLRDELLRSAALNGQKQSVAFLIAQGADINSKGFFDMTPLAHMAMYGAGSDENCAAVAEFLITNGAQIDPVDQYGGTPLLHAVQARKVKLVRVLLEHGASPARTYGTNGASSLQYAMRARDMELIKPLLDHKAPIAGTAEDGSTPLLMSVINRQDYDLTRLLLEHGATIPAPRTIPGLQHNGPSYWPLENENRERTPLLWAMYHRDKKLLALLLEFNAPLNAVDHNGRTPLHYAAAFNDLEMAQMLLNAKGDASIVDYEGATPLFLAEAAGNQPMAGLLRQAAPTASGVPAALPSREALQAVAQRVCSGNTAAFAEMTGQISVLFPTNRPGEAMRRLCFERWQAAEAVLGAEAGKGNPNAMATLKRFLAEKKLKYFALPPLGIAAAVGNSEALDMLLHAHQDYDILENSICFAVEPAARSNRPPAVAYFVNLARAPETPKNYFYGVGWMIKQVLESAATNGSPDARDALDGFLAVYKQ